jgi:hypothetical protein
MTGLVRKATLLLAVCGLMVATAASANVPDPTQSITPGFMRLMGHDGATADPFGTFSVTVKDLAGNVIANSSVVVDFSGTNDIQICSDQFGNSTADCPSLTVRKFTDGSGVATFTIIGNALTAIPAGSPLNAVKIFADGVLLSSPNAAAFDLNGTSGVNGIDLSSWLGDFGGGLNPPRSDYNGDATVSGLDLSVWLGVFGGGLSANSCGTTNCGP